jgi:hypothetical protein
VEFEVRATHDAGGGGWSHGCSGGFDIQYIRYACSAVSGRTAYLADRRRRHISGGGNAVPGRRNRGAGGLWLDRVLRKDHGRNPDELHEGGSPGERRSRVGSFTDPEYAQAGLTEAAARKAHDVLVTVVRFDTVARTIIDGRKAGYCKLITDRKTYQVLGCHVVGERAVDIVQVAAIVMSAGMSLEDFLRIPIAFPTYAGVLSKAVAAAARELGAASQSGKALSL